MAIDAKTVKELRDKTGLPMMKCKKALTETEGDVEKAMELLRKEGMKASDKRSDRENNEGIVSVSSNAGKSVIVELRCETDFVGKNPDFQQFAKDLCAQVLKENSIDVMAQKYIKNDSITTEEALQELTLKIGEKLSVGRVLLKEGLCQTYVHHDGKQAALVQLKGDLALSENDSVKEVLTGVCQHIVFATPGSLRPEEIDSALVDVEREKFKEEVKDKPENIQEKIIEGKVKKFFSEVCLLEQKYIKEEKKSVRQVVSDLSKEVKAEMEIISYDLISIGK